MTFGRNEPDTFIMIQVYHSFAMSTGGTAAEDELTIMRAYRVDIPKVNILKQKLGLASQQEVLRYLLAQNTLQEADA